MTLPFKISRTGVLWSIAVLVLLADAAVYYSVLGPRGRELTALEKEYLFRRNAQRSARENPGDPNAGFKPVYDSIPKWTEFTRIMGDVYKRAERLNLIVDSATYQTNEVKGSDLVSVKATMPVSGTYGEIKRFIYELETSPNLIIVEGVSLSKDKVIEEEVSLMLILKIHFKG